MSALGRLSPFGPIFTKELRVGARRKRTYALRVGYLAILLLALLGAYGSVGIGRAGGVAAQAERQQALGFAFFTAFAVCLMGTMTVVAPVLTANAIGAERLARTLPVLLMTPITAWQVVGGKLFSRLLTAMTLVGLSLPVLAMVRLLGGVELWQMGAVIALAVSFAVGSAAIGLFYSLFISRPAYVILLAYATLGVLYVLLPGCAIAILHPRRPPTPGVMQAYIAANPGMAVASVITPMGRMVVGNAWVGTVAVQLALGALLTAWTAALLRRQSRHQGERPDGAGATPASATPFPPPLSTTSTVPPPEATADSSAAAPTVPYFAPVSVPPVRKPRVSTPVGDNAVLWRELRQPLFRRTWQRVLAAVIVGGAFGLVYLAMASGRGEAISRPGPHIGFSTVLCFVWWLLATVLAATSATREKETDTWTLLIASPVRGSQVVWGKAAGVFRRMVAPTAIATGHFLLFAVAGAIPFWAVLFAVGMIVSTGALWVAVGVAVSMWAKRVTVTVVLSLLPAVLLYGGLPLVVAVVGGLVARRGDRAAEQTFWVNPYSYLGNGFDGMARIDRYNRASRDERSYGWYYQDTARPYRVARTDLSQGDFLGLAAACAAAHLGGAALVLNWAGSAFNGVTGRAGRRRPVGLLDDVPARDGPPRLSGPPPAAVSGATAVPPATEVDRLPAASFPRRAVAFVVDQAILQMVAGLGGLAWGIASVVGEDADELPTNEMNAILLRCLWRAALVAAATGWVVAAAFEASAWRATPGKALLGLFAADASGHRLSLGRALLRNLLKVVSAVPLGIGFLVAAVTPRRQALHDLIASTRVLRR